MDMNKSYLIIFSLALIILFSPSMLAYGISFTPQLYLKDSSPYGIPYADWIKKWWQWNVSVPKAEHPQTNPKAVCATKVSGQVSFLVQNLQGPHTIRVQFLPRMLLWFLFRPAHALQ